MEGISYERTDRKKVIIRMLVIVIPLIILFQILYFINFRTGNLTANVVEQAELIKQGRDSLGKEDAQFLCEDYEKEFDFRRELTVYELNQTDASGGNITKYVSLINFYIENKRDIELTDVTIKEKIPKSLTENVQELKFTTQPLSFSGDSVVFSFDKIGANEVKIVGYSVDRKISKKVLEDYDSPQVLMKKVYEGPALNRSLALIIFIILLIVVLFLYFKHFIRPKIRGY